MLVLKFGFLLLAVNIYGQTVKLLPVYSDSNGKFFAVQSSESETLEVVDGNLKIHKTTDKLSSRSLTANLSKHGLSVGFGYVKHTVATTIIEHQGGQLKIPLTGSCLENEQCRRDMLNLVSGAVENGVGNKQLENVLGNKRLN